MLLPKPNIFDVTFDKVTNPKKIFIDSQIPLYILNNTNNDLVKLDIVCESGSYYDKIPGSSYLLSKMFLGGTNQKSSFELIDSLEFYGSSLNISVSPDLMKINIISHKKDFLKILDILEDIFCNSTFPRDFFDNEKRLLNEKIDLDNSKNKTVAIKNFSELVFGKKHPYGRYLTKDHVDNIKISDIIDFFNSFFFNNTKVYLVINEETEPMDTICKKLSFINKKSLQKNVFQIDSTKKSSYIEKKESLQSSICIGKLLPSMNDSDYMKIDLVSKFLGGYFGSKLMSNLREKKGLTYGINTCISKYQGYSLFYIITEVKKSKRLEAVESIYSEVKSLVNEDVLIENLNGFKTYFKGNLVLSFDNTFATMDKFIHVNSHMLDMNYFCDLFNCISNFSSDDIKSISNKYFLKEDMYESIVG